jgi:hypothetical protein
MTDIDDNGDDQDIRDFSGMWRCAYWYPSNERPGEQDMTEYYVSAKQTGDKIVLESLPNRTDHIVVNLTVDHHLATGNWVEDTKPEGEFEGIQYSGAVQLLVSDDKQRLDGAWVGVGREKLEDGSYEPRIYTGKWEITRAGSKTDSK